MVHSENPFILKVNDVLFIYIQIRQLYIALVLSFLFVDNSFIKVFHYMVYLLLNLDLSLKYNLIHWKAFILLQGVPFIIVILYIVFVSPTD